MASALVPTTAPREGAPGPSLPRHDERGLSESVQWAVLVPVVMLAILGTIQAAVLLHGRSVAAHAALAGAETQALAGSGNGSGERVAREIAASGGLREVEVQVADGREVSLVVSARVDTFLAVGPTRVRSHAVMPKEAPR